MLSTLARGLFHASAACPIALAYALARRSEPRPYRTPSLVAAVCLAAAFLAIVLAARYTAQEEPVVLAKSSSKDRDVFLFLLSSVAPMASVGTSADVSGAMIAMVAAAIVLLCVLNLLQAHPLMALIGYHAYEVATKGGDSAILFSRSTVVPDKVVVVRLTDAAWVRIR